MTFKTFLKLTDAKALNEPSISSFSQIAFDPLKVKRGDLFLSNDPDQIEIALQRDAYAIVSEKNVSIKDSEIAWMQCQSFESVLISLLRYYLMPRDDIRVYYFDQNSIELLAHIVEKDAIIFLDPDDMQKNFHRISQAPANAYIIGSDLHYLESIYPRFFHPKIELINHLTLTSSTLFQSSFLYRGNAYNHIRLPRLFFKAFTTILNFLDQQEIAYDITKCDFISSFYPLFITKELRIQPFGTTQMTLIVTQDQDFLPQTIAYLEENTLWAKSLLFLHKNLKKSIASNSSLPTISYKNLSEIIKLKNLEFNFAIINAPLQEVVERLENLQTKEQLSLF